MKKRTLSLTLVLVFLCNLMVATSQASYVETDKERMSKEEVMVVATKANKMLQEGVDEYTVLNYYKEAGIISEDDLKMVLAFENTAIMRQSRANKPFPSNPELGDWHTMTYRVSKSTIATAGGGSVGAIVVYLMGLTGLGAAAVTGAAAVIASLMADNADVNGFEITVEYQYVYDDNEMMETWKPYDISVDTY